MGDEFVKGLLALIGVGDRTTDAVKTSQGVMDGSKSEFAKKMNWLSENPNMTDQQRQLIGQTGQTGSAWQEKMNWHQCNARRRRYNSKLRHWSKRNGHTCRERLSTRSNDSGW